ncbi:hypothetical protein TNCV_3081471 [Trichonephila clavipes]|nr:hypothetical protein TNCV_3081471 [Trichonephila clavipes]
MGFLGQLPARKVKLLKMLGWIQRVVWFSGGSMKPSKPYDEAELRFHATDAGFNPRVGQDRLGFSSLQWVDE